jgi:hypothetical protein
MLPALVFALSFCNSVAVRFNYVFWLTFDDLITIATGLTLALTTYQFGKDYKVRAIEHRLASNEFDALVQLIEATGFTDVDDRNFADIDSRLERIRRTVRHVPERDWKAARRAFGKDISGARNRIRPAATLPQHEDHN